MQFRRRRAADRRKHGLRYMTVIHPPSRRVGSSYRNRRVVPPRVAETRDHSPELVSFLKLVSCLFNHFRLEPALLFISDEVDRVGIVPVKQHFGERTSMMGSR